MTWSTITLADGRKLPEIGFGSWTAGSGETVVGQIKTAIDVGFDHIDTAQIYGNEAECGDGIKESGIARKDIWVTTKWSGKGGKGIRESLEDSLRSLGLKYVDLYLIHSPRLVGTHPLDSWEEMIQLKREGLVKSIGVSNYGVVDLEVIKLSGKEMPVVNQILLHPYVLVSTLALLAYHKANDITTEAYSTLIPITKKPGGAVDKVITRIAERLSAGEKQHVNEAMVLMAWAREKEAVVVTASRQKSRLEEYLAAGSIALAEQDIKDIDKAGALGIPSLAPSFDEKTLLAERERDIESGEEMRKKVGAGWKRRVVEVGVMGLIVLVLRYAEVNYL